MGLIFCLDPFKVGKSSHIISLFSVTLLLFIELKGKKKNDSEFNIIYSKTQTTLGAT